MIIVKMQGGLGNQMQQYALYEKLRTLGKDVKLDISWFEDEELQKKMAAPRALEIRRFTGLPMEICTKEEADDFTGGGTLLSRVKKKLMGNTKVFEESRMYHPEIFGMEEKYLIGYFACNYYYADILRELRDLFRFPDSPDPVVNEKNRKTMEQMHAEGEVSASIHLRRGDYLDAVNADILGGICTPEYYAGAIRYLEDNINPADGPLHFYVFSDDPDFARTCRFGTRGEEVTVCDWNTGDDNMLDMQLMAHCRCNITANSTFSFWGARLNVTEKPVRIRPLYHRNNQTPDAAEMHKFWNGYVLVDKQGNVV